MKGDGSLKKHDTLVDICKELLISQGLEVETHKEYDFGEMDLLCNNIYYEIKCNYTSRNYNKAHDQLERAIKYKKAQYGYLISNQGFFDILKS